MKKQLVYHDRMYTCSDCGKFTRDTGTGEGGSDLCKTCFKAAETYNEVQDGDLTPEEFSAYLAEIGYQGSEFE